MRLFDLLNSFIDQSVSAFLEQKSGARKCESANLITRLCNYRLHCEYHLKMTFQIFVDV